jgi:hypothetical protein
MHGGEPCLKGSPGAASHLEFPRDRPQKSDTPQVGDPDAVPVGIRPLASTRS